MLKYVMVEGHLQLCLCKTYIWVHSYSSNKTLNFFPCDPTSILDIKLGMSYSSAYTCIYHVLLYFYILSLPTKKRFRLQRLVSKVFSCQSFCWSETVKFCVPHTAVNPMSLFWSISSFLPGLVSKHRKWRCYWETAFSLKSL